MAELRRWWEDAQPGRDGAAALVETLDHQDTDCGDDGGGSADDDGWRNNVQRRGGGVIVIRGATAGLARWSLGGPRVGNFVSCHGAICVADGEDRGSGCGRGRWRRMGGGVRAAVEGYDGGGRGRWRRAPRGEERGGGEGERSKGTTAERRHAGRSEEARRTEAEWRRQRRRLGERVGFEDLSLRRWIECGGGGVRSRDGTGGVIARGRWRG
uniref:DUF834 domain-containing protein n=1 Tax=Oryza nivara TaxID=4536 RepID=A0A0E0GP85_ORYNI